MIKPPSQKKAIRAYISGNALQLALGTCNAPLRVPIDEKTMLDILKGNISEIREWKCHVEIFFNEVHPCILAKIAADYDISIERMGDAFFKLPKAYRQGNFAALYKAATTYGLEMIWEEKDGNCCLTMPC